MLLTATTRTSLLATPEVTCDAVLAKCTLAFQALVEEKTAMQRQIEAQAAALAERPTTHVPWWAYAITGIATGVILKSTLDK